MLVTPRVSIGLGQPKSTASTAGKRDRLGAMPPHPRSSESTYM